MGHSDLLSNGTSYKQYSLHFGAKICTGVLSADTVCFEKQIVLQKQSSRKTVSFDERKKFKDKHPRVFFKSIRGYFVCCLQISFATRGIFSTLGHITRILPVLAILVPRGHAPFGLRTKNFVLWEGPNF